MASIPETVAATFCATLVDEWRRAGLTDAFVAPGSRSTPLALALVAHDELHVHVFHDERSAAFAALGHGLLTGRPAVVLCSSGTAGTHFHAAVVESDLSSVPLIVCTADRPPRLHNIGAPQVIDQSNLFGDVLRHRAIPGVPRADAADDWRSFASHAWNAAVGSSGHAGPVHLNLAFDEPLVGQPGDLPSGRDDNRPWHAVSPRSAHADIDAIAGRLPGRHGVVVAGGCTSDPGATIALAAHLGWPLLADHRSGCRRSGMAINHFDSLLRHEAWADAERPQVILRVGRPLASKALSQWIAGSGADVIVGQTGRIPSDPERAGATFADERGLALALLERLPPDLAPSAAADRWLAADAQAAAAIEQICRDGVTEPGVARATLQSVPAGGSLVVASSMPVRDLEWFAPSRTGIDVFANRGANGIDGTIATAAGIALAGRPTTLIIGDVAFLHDATSLTALAGRGIDLTIVVIDNDGGGIFSFLPQRDLLPTQRFERLFGTPHGTDIAMLAAAHGITVEEWGPGAEPACDLVPSGARIVIARTDRSANVDLHERLHAAVASALG